MLIEQASIEIGHLAQQRLEFGCMFTLAQSFVKQLQQEIAVEGMELAFASFLLHAFQSVGKIIEVSIKPVRYLRVQEALELDKIDKHQSIEHEGGIPLAISLRVNSLNEFQ